LKGNSEVPLKTNLEWFLAMIVLFLVLLLAYALDLGYLLLANRIRETFTFLPVATAALFPLGVSALVILISWFSFERMSPRSAASIVYFLVGLTFQLSLIFSLRSFPVWLRGTFLESFRMVVFSHGLISNFLILSAAITILGLISLIRRSPGEGVSSN
jgi:hypothetical protein